MDIQVDRAIPVPIAAQIKGQIEYGISYGLIEPGSKLLNVRELAKRLKVSPATVSQVYQDLKQQGIIVSTPGRGSYVSEELPGNIDSGDRFAALDADIQQLIAQAKDLGLSKSDLLHKISHQLNGSETPSGLSVAFVGEFMPASRTYGRAIRKYLQARDRFEIFTFEGLNQHDVAPETLKSFDLLLAAAHRSGELRTFVPRQVKVLGVSFIPSEATRMALVKLDPLAKVGLVSTFPGFLGVLKGGVTTFAPHVTITATAILGTAHIDKLSETCDVIIYASGSEEIVETLGESTVAIEYLHTPDPTYLRQVLAPLLFKLRRTLKAAAIT